MAKAEKIEAALDDLVEQLAAIEHDRWSLWQRHLHSRCTPPDANGALLIPAQLVSRWEGQLATSYAELSEQEKESDREQVRKYLPLIKEHLRNTL